MSGHRVAERFEYGFGGDLGQARGVPERAFTRKARAAIELKPEHLGAGRTWGRVTWIARAKDGGLRAPKRRGDMHQARIIGDHTVSVGQQCEGVGEGGLAAEVAYRTG